MRYGSICSGIEAASVAWRPLGWQCAFVSETARFQSKLLKLRYPSVPNLGDFTKITKESFNGDIDVLVGGTPCQPYSRLGRKTGMGDPRGCLAIGFGDLARRTRARWLVWENVPCVLSSRRGRDFAAFLSNLAGWEIPVPSGGWRTGGIVAGAKGGYGAAWRVLDARSVRSRSFPRGIPQRRKRLVLVGHIGDWRGPAEALVVPGMREDDPQTGEGAVRDAPEGDRGSVPRCYPLDLTNLDGRGRKIAGKGYDERPGAAAYTMTRRRPPGVCAHGRVRMLTPVECERAFGFPDGYTAMPWHGRDAANCPDWSRYRALGNSMCVNMMEWIGERIAEVDERKEFEDHGQVEDRGADGEPPSFAEGGGG